MVFTLKFRNDGLFQLAGAVDRGVLGKPPMQGIDRGLFDMLRGIEIRLTGTQSDDILTLGAQFVRPSRDGQGLRRFDTFDTIRQFDIQVKTPQERRPSRAQRRVIIRKHTSDLKYAKAI